MGHLRSGMAALVAAVGMAAAAAEAGPVYGFSRVTSNGSVDVASQLTMEVERVNGGRSVQFTFRNTGTVPSAIVEIAFDDDSLLNIVQRIDSAGDVNFARAAGPGALPGGNVINFNTTLGLIAAGEGMEGGINPGESLTVEYDLVYGQSPFDTESALSRAMEHPGEDVVGGLRVGLVVQGIDGSGASDTFVSTPVRVSPAVSGHSAPLPGVGAMGLVGLLAVAARRRSRPVA